jgi:hypothetical protein
MPRNGRHLLIRIQQDDLDVKDALCLKSGGPREPGQTSRHNERSHERAEHDLQ